MTAVKAIRATSRMRPDILVLDEAVRVGEGMKEAFRAAAKGATVILSLHSYSTTTAVSRLVYSFDPNDSHLLGEGTLSSRRSMVSELLLGVATVQVARHHQTNERRRAYEVLGTSPELKSAILESDGPYDFSKFFKKNPHSIKMEDSLKVLEREGYYSYKAPH